jgi:hypothetical protein
MTDASGLPRSPVPLNIIRHRGDPKSAILDSGDIVKKEEYVYFKDDQGRYQKLECAEYHTAHFVFLDPRYMRSGPQAQSWFALCTCGSAAVIVGPQDAQLERVDAKERMLVCMAFHQHLVQTGRGWHQGSDGRQWR